MLKLQSRAAAIALGGALAIGLPAGFVLAAANHDAHGDAVATAATSSTTIGEAHGDAVSAVATSSTTADRDAHGDTASTAARGSGGTSSGDGDIIPDPTAQTLTTGDSGTGGDAHGDAVSAVARDSSKVGGKNGNHGGAVSAVARGNAGIGAGVRPVQPLAQGTTVSTAATSSTTIGEAHGDTVSTVARSH